MVDTSHEWTRLGGWYLLGAEAHSPIGIGRQQTQVVGLVGAQAESEEIDRNEDELGQQQLAAQLSEARKL